MHRYRVAPGDHLTGIAARFGIEMRVLAAGNHLDPQAPLPVGLELAIDNRHLVPTDIAEGILINVPQRMLYLLHGATPIGAWPVALGKPDWPTPSTVFRVASRVVDKPWIVPWSIQQEMRLEGKPVLTRVEPGPDNPLGRHWIGLSRPGYGIHGTNAPASIYSFRSHGCIRMHPDDVEQLFGQIGIGTPGEIVYRNMLMAEAPNGRIFVEVHRDIYRRTPACVDAFRRLAIRRGLESRIDWQAVAQAVDRQDGIARDVGIAREVTVPPTR